MHSAQPLLTEGCKKVTIWICGPIIRCLGYQKSWIGGLAAKVENGSECFIVNRFRVGAVEHSIAYVEGLANAPDQPDFLLMNAVSTALYLEKALIENKYFEVLSGDGAETKRILNALTQSTQAHYQRVNSLRRELG